ncbi:MAG: hypothetical protein ABWZ82_00755 [Candidatus Limnocylindrales bacterium]
MTDLSVLVAGLAALRASGSPRLVAVGWATVDLERTLDDLGIADGGLIVDEPLLGARASRIDLGGTAVLVLEPTTEGRLAAALARRGEGICALYLSPDGPGGRSTQVTALGLPGRLLPHDQPWGPFVIEVEDR